MINPFLEPLPLPKNPRLTDNGNKSLSNHPVIYPFLQRLEGYKTNLKGHHWHGYNNSTHVRIDEFFDIVGDAQDAIAECGMGVYGIMTLGFTGIPSNNWEILSLCQNIINDFIFVNKQLEDEDQNLGLLNRIQDVIEQLHRHKLFIEYSLAGVKD